MHMVHSPVFQAKIAISYSDRGLAHRIFDIKITWERPALASLNTCTLTFHCSRRSCQQQSLPKCRQNQKMWTTLHYLRLQGLLSKWKLHQFKTLINLNRLSIWIETYLNVRCNLVANIKRCSSLTSRRINITKIQQRQEFEEHRQTQWPNDCLNLCTTHPTIFDVKSLVFVRPVDDWSPVKNKMLFIPLKMPLKPIPKRLFELKIHTQKKNKRKIKLN